MYNVQGSDTTMFNKERSARTKKRIIKATTLAKLVFLGVKLINHNHRLIGERARFSEKIASYGR